MIRRAEQRSHRRSQIARSATWDRAATPAASLIFSCRILPQSKISRPSLAICTRTVRQLSGPYPSLLSPKGHPRFAVTGWMRIGGKDGSYTYVTSPDAAGHNPSDDLTPYGIPWDYIFQGTHTTTGGYVDTMNCARPTCCPPSPFAAHLRVTGRLASRQSTLLMIRQRAVRLCGSSRSQTSTEPSAIMDSATRTSSTSLAPRTCSTLSRSFTGAARRLRKLCRAGNDVLPRAFIIVPFARTRASGPLRGDYELSKTYEIFLMQIWQCAAKARPIPR